MDSYLLKPANSKALSSLMSRFVDFCDYECHKTKANRDVITPTFYHSSGSNDYKSKFKRPKGDYLLTTK